MASWIDDIATELRRKRETADRAERARQPTVEKAERAFQRLKEALNQATTQLNVAAGAPRIFEVRELADGNLTITRLGHVEGWRIGVLEDGVTVHSHRTGSFVPAERAMDRFFRIVAEGDGVAFHSMATYQARQTGVDEGEPLKIDDVVRQITEPFFRESLGLN